MTYRADIDGLRAIAVLAVVIFHLGVPGFAGGYVGVDVFFVISGYLITSLIRDRVEGGDFGMLAFYSRRIRRLFPPLAVTVAATFLGAAFILTPLDFIALGRSAAAALFSLSNLVFYAEAGYWDTAAEFKPLLHTWSLGLEEQFYLFWPAMVLWLSTGWRQRYFTTLLFALVIGGYALCIWWTARDPSAAFYLLPFRIFEFALGALIIPASRWRWLRDTAGRWHGADALVLLGLATIAASVAMFDAKTAFPGWVVIWPALGAALVLLAGSIAPVVRGPGRYLLQNPLCLWLGRVSYSMYLVHWPVIALYRHATGKLHLTPGDQCLLAALTLAGTVSLHYFVERRYYRRADSRPESHSVVARPLRSARAIVVCCALLALFPLSAWLGDGWSWRQPNLVMSPDDVERGMQDRFKLVKHACSVRRWDKAGFCEKERPLQVLFFGNSLEPDAYNFFHAVYGEDREVNLIKFGSTNNCPGLEGGNGVYRSANRGCSERFEALFREDIVERIDVLVYATPRPFVDSRQLHLDVIRDLKSRNPNIKLVTFGGYIVTEQPCWRLINEKKSSKACADPGQVIYFDQDPSVWPLYTAFMAITDLYIDRVSLLCGKRKLKNCYTQTPERVPMNYDELHASLEFSQFAGRLYERSNPDFLKRLAAETPKAML